MNKNKTIFGVVLGIVISSVLVVALAYTLQHSNDQKWLATYHATSLCNKEDEHYFLSMLGQNSVNEASVEDKLALVTKIGSDCEIKRADSNPILLAFDTTFHNLSEQEQIKVFNEMADSTSFFTARILLNEPGWNKLTIEQLSARLPLLIDISPKRKALILERYENELREASALQRDKFIETTKQLQKHSLPAQVDEFGADLRAMQNSLNTLSALQSYMDKRTNDSRVSDLEKASDALKSASDAFDKISGNSDISKYTYAELIIGQEVFVPGTQGHYYLSLMPSNPQQGRILLHVADGNGLSNQGLYNAWVRIAHLDEIVKSDIGAWVFTYEAANSDTREIILKMQNGARKLIANANELAGMLAPPPLLEAVYTRMESDVVGNEQARDELIKVLSNPNTAEDWRFLSKLDELWSTDCGDAAFCIFRANIVRRAEMNIIRNGPKPPSGIDVSFKLAKKEG